MFIEGWDVEETNLEYVKELRKIIWDVLVNFLYECARNWISPTR